MSGRMKWDAARQKERLQRLPEVLQEHEPVDRDPFVDVTPWQGRLSVSLQRSRSRRAVAALTIPEARKLVGLLLDYLEQ